MEAGYKNFNAFVERGMTEETVTRNLHFRSQMRWVEIGQVNYTGRIEIADAHCKMVALSVTPSTEAAGGRRTAEGKLYLYGAIDRTGRQCAAL